MHPQLGALADSRGLLRHLAGDRCYLREPFDHVITVCDEANEACPFFPGAKNRLHWSFEDPSRTTGSDEERLEAFRVTRDGIQERIESELLV